jgi:hypothetical protein
MLRRFEQTYPTVSPMPSPSPKSAEKNSSTPEPELPGDAEESDFDEAQDQGPREPKPPTVELFNSVLGLQVCWHFPFH